MLRINLKCLLRNPLDRNFCASTKIREYATKMNPVVQSTGAGDNPEIKESTEPTTSKLPARAPLAKNLFLGVVDKDLLRFPEVISRDDTEKLTERTLPIQSYFKDAIDTKSIDLTRCVPKEIMENLTNLGLFGLNIPRNYGGQEFSTSAITVASEPEQASADIAAILQSHRVVSDVISEFGSDYQKNKYLSKLGNGSIVATEAIFETKPTDARLFGTAAEYDEMEKLWTLNGEKSFVINATEAHLILVLAQAHVLNTAGNMEDAVRIFLVDSKTPGVKVDGPVLSFGLRGSQQGTVSFKDVRVSEDNVIGNINNTSAIVQGLLKSNRLKTGLTCTGMMKNLLREMTDYAIHTKQNGIYLKDIKLISDRLSRIVCSIYAMESMTFLTTGLIDEFDKQDVDLEAAITKLYSLETLWKSSTTCMEFMGPKCLEAGQQSEIFLRNAAQLYTQGETVDSLRLYIGLLGLQHVGLHNSGTILKDRNPFFYPMHILSRFLDKQTIESPTLKFHLEAEVHPSLDIAAKSMEQSILRLQMTTEILLGRYGSDIVQEPLEISRLTECISLIYAMFASTARASRSYCIGLENSKYEILIATMIAYEGATRIKIIATELANGPYLTNDVNNQRIAKQLFKNQKYFYEHPLKYNF